MDDEHERLLLGGQVSVTPWYWGSEESVQEIAIILLLGSTGSGKSSFIEALSGSSSLGISKDQLEGYTKTVTPYKLVNAGYGPRGSAYDDPEGTKICLLDTPGFSDSTLSEYEIIEMVKEWLRAHRISYVDHIMYMCAITDTRLPASRKATMEMVKALVNLGRQDIKVQGGRCNEGALSIVTTMWDTLWSDRARARAEAHYSQLGDEIWKDLIDKGACITRFTNTTDSALDILDKSRIHWGAAYGSAYSTDHDRFELSETEYGKYLYRNLERRIASAREEKHSWEIELAKLGSQSDVEGNDAWVLAVRERLDAAESTLARFESQLAKVRGDAPEGFEETEG